jgi:CHAT domain-containing protein
MLSGGMSLRRFRIGIVRPGRLVAAWVAIAGICGGAARASAMAPADFLEREQRALALLETSPDTILAESRAGIARDSSSFFDRWFEARVLARADTATAATLLRQAAARPGSPGLQLQAAAVLFEGRRNAPARAALDRARDGYLAAARSEDAARAAMWKPLHDRAAGPADESAFVWAESLARSTGNSALVAEVRIRRGGWLTSRDPREAQLVLREALAAPASLPPGYLQADAHRVLADALRAGRQLDSAEVHARVAAQLAREGGHAHLESRSWQALANVQSAGGRQAEALVTLRNALDSSPREYPRQRANLLGEMGIAQSKLKRFSEARGSFEASLAILDSIGSHGLARVGGYVNLGSIAEHQGDFEAARSWFERGLAECRAIGRRDSEANVLARLVIFHENFGDFERAWAYLDEGLALARQTGVASSLRALCQLKASLLCNQDRCEEALPWAREAERVARERDPKGTLAAMSTTWDALFALHRDAEALALGDSMIALATAQNDSFFVRHSLQHELQIRLRRGEVEPSLALARRLVEAQQAAGDPGGIAGSQMLLGRALLAAGRPEEAAPPLARGLAAFEGVRASLGASEERATFQSRWDENYAYLALAHARAGRVADALRTLDGCRARELRAFYEASGSGSPRVPADLVRDLRSAEAELAEAQAQLFSQYALPPSARARNVAQLETRCERLRSRVTEAGRRIERIAPALARKAGLAAPLDVAALQRALGSDQAMLAYLVGEDRTLAFLVTRDRLEWRELAWGESALRTRVEEWVGALEAGGGDAWRQPAALLADSLLGGWGSAEHARIVYVVRDGPLHYLPFEPLLVRRSGGGRRALVERCDVVYASSPSLLLAEAARPGAQGLAAFGDPTAAAASEAVAMRALGPGARLGSLPHARREAEGLRAYYPEARVFLGPEATEARMRSELGRASMLHVAAHGFADERHPRFSGLLLARDSSASGSAADGVLQAFELLDTPCRADLVTLSACETGRGRLVRGEGMLGLASALQMAGARNLVVSQWKVDDAATAEFMLAFYRHLSAGAEPAAALARVKRERLTAGSPAASPAAVAGSGPRGVGQSRESALRSHPSSWAAFVLIGGAVR